MNGVINETKIIFSRLKTPLTLLLTLTFLFLFSGPVYGEEEPEISNKYWDNGKLKWKNIYDFKNGKMLSIGWFESGNKEVEVHYKLPKEGIKSPLIQDGELNLWYENGNRRSTEFYNNGKKVGLLTTWYESGKEWSETNYKNGKRNGLTIAWYKSGGKQEQFHFKRGKFEGKQIKWYKSGKKMAERHYEEGIEIGIRKEWDKDGKLTYKKTILMV